MPDTKLNRLLIETDDVLNRLLTNMHKTAAKSAGWSEEGFDPAAGQLLGDEDLQALPVANDLEKNLAICRAVMPSWDLITHTMQFGSGPGNSAALVYLAGMTDAKHLEKTIMPAIQRAWHDTHYDLFGSLKRAILPTSSTEVTDFQAALNWLLYGGVLLFVAGQGSALAFYERGWPTRAVEDSDSERVVRGAHESFVEDLLSNTALVRHRLRSPNLIIETIRLGRMTQTEVALFYVRGLASSGLVQELRARLQRIDIDGVLEINYLSENIQDSRFSLFPLILDTERPDRVVAGLLEGKVAVLAEGSARALLMPADIISLLQTADDYYTAFPVASVLRLLRITSLLVSLFLPALYIAVTSFHQEMLPTRLLTSVAAARIGVPFPGLLEAVLTELSLEVLRKASLRMPNKLSSTIGIVGAVVLGQVAVQAGLVSPAMLIVVAVTAVASFTNPSFALGLSLRYLRFGLMLMAGSLGLYGLMLGSLLILVHLNSLRSFGVPYLPPLEPSYLQTYGDFFIRRPLWRHSLRPPNQMPQNRVQQSHPIGPQSPQSDTEQGGEKDETGS